MAYCYTGRTVAVTINDGVTLTSDDGKPVLGITVNEMQYISRPDFSRIGKPPAVGDVIGIMNVFDKVIGLGITAYSVSCCQLAAL